MYHRQALTDRLISPGFFSSSAQSLLINLPNRNIGDLTAHCQITAIPNVKTAEKTTPRAIKRITASKSCHLDSCRGLRPQRSGRKTQGTANGAWSQVRRKNNTRLMHLSCGNSGCLAEGTDHWRGHKNKTPRVVGEGIVVNRTGDRRWSVCRFEMLDGGLTYHSLWLLL